MSWQPSTWMVRALAALAVAGAIALLLGAPQALVTAFGLAGLALVAAWGAIDGIGTWLAWRRGAVRAERRLPSAMALGVPARVRLRLTNDGGSDRTLEVVDGVDASLAMEGLPATVLVRAGAAVELTYTVTPRRRGLARFGTVHLRQVTPRRALLATAAAGAPGEVRVYPDFAAVARYAWLAGDQRLAQIGIKTFAQRGSGTDFRQLRDYRIGDALRQVDWKATLRQRRPIVREFQDERDQRVVLLLDAGRRMRADEGAGRLGSGHFDQALNALMLLAYVALKQGDEVGAMTFGTAPEEARGFAPRKGLQSLNGLMNRLYDVEPGLGHPDYLQAARDLLQRHPRRSLVIVLTNFRDEDADELGPALRLLRRRHLVLVASLREQVLRDMASQRVTDADAATQVAAAHLLRQSRHDAFRRAVGDDALSIDVEPSQLAAELVNRYHLVKRAGLL